MAAIITLPAYGDVHFAAPVADVASLPTTDPQGSVRLVIATYLLYVYTGAAWALYGTASTDTFPNIAVTDNTNQIVLGTTNTYTVTMAALSGNRTFTLPNANSNPVVPDTGAANNFLTAISALGVISKAQPAFSNLSGSAVLTSQVSGVLPVANGGTNSATSLNSNRFIVSSGGAILEASAVTASRALASDANGLPVAATTTATELGYVNGVTSAIQTQIAAKEATIAAGTTAQYWRGDKSFQALNVAAITPIVDGSSGGTTKLNEVLTASQSSLTTSNVGSTGVYGYAISLSVTAGRWLAWGTVTFDENAAVLTGAVQCGISASSSGSGLSALDVTLYNGLVSSTSDSTFQCPMQVISISGTTTYYLNTLFSYSSGTPKHAGKINFLRIG